MHIAEGVLSPTVLGLGAVVTIAGTIYGLKKLKIDQLLITGVLAAFFFIASLVHVPIGISSAHLIGNGLIGVLLGFGAFPAILAALLLQALLLQFGGLTVLGVNTATIASGAICAALIFKLGVQALPNSAGIKIFGFCAGAFGVGISALFTALALAFTAEGFEAAAYALFVAHLPIMVVEGLITMLTLTFIVRTRPNYLPLPKNFQLAKG